MMETFKCRDAIVCNTDAESEEEYDLLRNIVTDQLNERKKTTNSKPIKSNIFFSIVVSISVFFLIHSHLCFYT